MVAQAILQYLWKHSIDENQLCRQAGLAPGRISGSVKGPKRLEIEEYVAVCAVLQLPYEYFFESRRQSA